MRFSPAKAATVLALASSALGAALVEHLATAPEGWTVVKDAGGEESISMQIALTQSNVHKLEEKLLDVSDPSSKNYGKHWTREMVDSFFKPASQDHDAVVEWLNRSGVKSMHTDGHIISLKTTVATANELLSTTYKYYSKDGVEKLRTTQYSVPEDILPYIDFITPTTYFGGIKANVPTFNRRSTPGSPSISPSCENIITPDCIKQLYSVGSYQPSPNSPSIVGFGSFLNNSAIYSDLFLYQKRFNIPHQSFSVTTINGGVNNQSTADPNRYGEANLDVQNINGVSHPLRIHEFITGGSPPFIPNLDEPTPASNENEPYLPYYQYLLSQSSDTLPQVISNSYGDDEQTVPPKYAARVCNMIGQLGMRGVTIFESAGDVGVGDACRANDGSNKLQFTPQFPGTCPYITAVGGTQSVSPEISWNTTSGGFSNYFSRPKYQDSAIENYFQNHIAPSTLEYYLKNDYFNKDGRGFPDVAAHSLFPFFLIYIGGQPTQTGGTSAASPIWAAIAGLLNDVRLSKGKSSLGFLNPWLYGGGYRYLNDITSGVTIGCTGTNLQEGTPIPGGGVIPYATWNGTVGWDPTTGWGTPNFAKLKDAACDLP